MRQRVIIVFWILVFSLIQAPQPVSAVSIVQVGLTASVLIPEPIYISDPTFASFSDIREGPNPNHPESYIRQNVGLVADYGRLGIYGDTQVFVDPLSPGGGSLLVFFSSFYDTITITSDTLPLGTPVDVQLSMNVIGGPIFVDNLQVATGLYAEAPNASTAALMSALMEPPGILDAQYGYTSGAVNGAGIAENYPQTNLSYGFSGFVGGGFSFNGYLTGQLSAGAAPEFPGFPIEHPYARAALNFMNTATYGIEVLTPGASFISESGATYMPTSVPEPSTLLLLASGLAGMAALRRKFTV